MYKFVSGMVLGVLVVVSLSAPAAPAKIATAAIQPQISGGNVTAACNINPFEIDILGDGSFVVDLAVTLNNNTRIRHNGISADGTTFTLDGLPVASPPAALQALGSHLSAASPKITAAYSVAAVQTALCGP
jgi:hypothetical protein